MHNIQHLIYLSVENICKNTHFHSLFKDVLCDVFWDIAKSTRITHNRAGTRTRWQLRI